MPVTKITIGRLYNLGSYEHIRYEIAAEVPEGESAEKMLTNLEKIITALAPESKQCVKTRGELDRDEFRIKELGEHLITLDEDEFKRKHGHFVGSPAEYCERVVRGHKEEVAKREAYETRSKAAREMLNALGGEAKWKDAKLDWETQDDGF